MADLDTTSKRRSSVQILMPFEIAPLLPDGTISLGDRQHIAKTYGFGAIVGPVFIGGPAIGTEKRRKRRPDFEHWPAMIWPTPKPPEGTTVQPVEVLTPDAPKPALEREIMGTPVPSAAMVGAVRRNAPSTPLLDTATRRRIMEMQQRLRMEIEDEEALLMLGAFDD